MKACVNTYESFKDLFGKSRSDVCNTRGKFCSLNFGYVGSLLASSLHERSLNLVCIKIKGGMVIRIQHKASGSSRSSFERWVDGSCGP